MHGRDESNVPSGITAVPGIEVGHHTCPERPTGCTVVLARDGAVGGVDVRGSAPGTREIALLDPVHAVQDVHAVVLAGGSAFGLDAASGVMRYLDERDIGYRIGGKTVPIVVGAILFDLMLEGETRVRPGPDCGYRAADAASGRDTAEGSVGAGAGATVGKLLGLERAMKGGFGSASRRASGGITVGAAAAVNAVGDVVDPATGQVVAGVRTPDGRGLADARVLIRQGRTGDGTPAGGANTTLGVVATDARLTKAQATKVAQMAQDGLARTLYPAHTMADGDTVFALATGQSDARFDLSLLGALAADALAEAVLRAVRTADGLTAVPGVTASPGLPALPSVRDLAAL